MKMSLWVEKCYKACHHFILKYTEGSEIPPEWIAGIINVECGRLDPKASRFEPHVYESIMWVKKGNKSKSFPGFNTGKIYQYISKTNDVSLLKSLATSYGLGQLMGYHYLDKFNIKPEEYMNLTFESSVKYTVEFARIGYKFIHFPYREKGAQKYSPFDQLLRWWNTGSTTGVTYNSDYTKRANEAASLYKQYMNEMETKANELKKDDSGKFD
jgi:hypothetical protein